MKVSTLERTSCFERKNQALEQKDNEVILVYIYMPCSAMLANMASTEKFTKKQVSKPNHLFFSKRTYKIGKKNYLNQQRNIVTPNSLDPILQKVATGQMNGAMKNLKKALLLSDGSRIAQ
ncbi:hypothetical protein [Streptococcus suis]|uniref:hypothetical protein n=1 Tax=Streptococcus suis TaxID=1307 RepID=UPI0019169AF5|nr:hypothetical protein [Streptococcus suis]